VEQELSVWDDLKRQEKHHTSYTDTLEAVARTLPATWRAEKLQKKAAKAGFDWPDVSGQLAKTEEELGEVKEALNQGNQDHIFEEVGDLLFAAVNLARRAGVDPEFALDAANEKFIRRFAATESRLEGDMAQYNLSQQLAAYKQAKEEETKQ
jgi:tetrapyrrole methylase family protein/MazG family protein